MPRSSIPVGDGIIDAPKKRPATESRTQVPDASLLTWEHVYGDGETLSYILQEMGGIMLFRNDWKLCGELVEHSLKPSLGGAGLCAAQGDGMRILYFLGYAL